MTETRCFQAEVSRLLDIVTRSLYRDKGIFLRELISNASDACNRRRYLALETPELGAPEGAYRVTLSADPSAGVLVVEDNGLGMSKAELIENLGTIARSGTANFVRQMTEAGAVDDAMIGQFGVGFYAAFMVADRVEVLSRKAGTEEAHCWISDGKGEFSVAPAEKAEIGTRIALHLRDGERDYLQFQAIRPLVETHSNHISLPILWRSHRTEHVLNAASALWARSKSEVTPEQYRDFYRATTRSVDDPWLTMHWSAEGKLAYSGLLFVPPRAPDTILFEPDRREHLKLFARRVLVAENCQGLLPRCLRFVCGVVDTEDLPLNVNRDALRNNPLLPQLQQGLIKHVLDALGRKAAAEPAEYLKFWANFGVVLKEGLFDRDLVPDKLLSLLRFDSSAAESAVSLDDYIGRLRPGQEAIYYILSDKKSLALKSPQLESFRARGVEVLLLTDRIDEAFWLSPGRPDIAFKGYPLKSVVAGAADLGAIEALAGAAAQAPSAVPPAIDALISRMKAVLSSAVKDVRLSSRLADSAACLVIEHEQTDLLMIQAMRRFNDPEMMARTIRKVLEINPQHSLIRMLADRLAADGGSRDVREAAWLILDLARIAEGEIPPDQDIFVSRMTARLEHSLALRDQAETGENHAAAL